MNNQTNDSDDYELDEEFDQVNEDLNKKTETLKLFEDQKSSANRMPNIDSDQMSDLLKQFKHLSPDKMQKIIGQMSQQFGLDRSMIANSLKTHTGNYQMTTAERLRQKIELRRQQSADHEKKTENKQDDQINIPKKKKRKKKKQICINDSL